MIPQFPQFKSLDITDQQNVECFIRRFPPYSDFNFISLLCYNTRGETQISLLHGNLVVKMLDYTSAKPVYTFLGCSNVIETVTTLLRRLDADGINPILRMIPHCIIDATPELIKELQITEDIDSFDYVYRASEMSSLSGALFLRKRQHIAHFKRSYPQARLIDIDLTNDQIRDRVVRVLGLWQVRKQKSDEDVAIEFEAIRRALKFIRHLHLMARAIEHNETLVGFVVFELIHNGYAMEHFLKADPAFAHASDVLHHDCASHIHAKGCTLLNCQQDLGIVGLRQSKSSWRPTEFLKKYTIAYQPTPLHGLQQVEARESREIQAWP